MSVYGSPHAYHGGMSEADWRALPSNERCECANCDWRGPMSALKDIKRYHERVDPEDGVEPAGECPECGCLAYDAEA